jgi:hypothetical protein
MLMLLAVFLGGSALPATAQDTAVAGYYSSSDKKPLTIRFFFENGTLVAHMLWNGGLVHFVADSPLVYTGNEIGLHFKFRKSPAGEVDQAELNGGVWTKVQTYSGPVTPAPKQVQVSPARMKPYEGLYQSSNDPARFFRVFIKDDHLWSRQEWDGGEVPYAAASDSGFFIAAAPQFWLDFSRDEKGNVTGMTRFKEEKWTKRDRTPLTEADRQALNGDYVSKDDPDNSIRLSVAGDQVTLTQLWDNKKLVLDEQTNSYFYNSKEKYPLVVLKDEQGHVTRVVILTQDVFTRKDSK